MKLIQFNSKRDIIYIDISKITFIESYNGSTRINFAGGNPIVVHITIDQAIEIINKNTQQ